MQLISAEVANIAKALADLDKQAKATGIVINGEVRIGNTGFDVRYDAESGSHVIVIGG